MPGDVPRGMAETILFSEKYGACSYWALDAGREVPWYVATETSGFQILPETCDPTVPQSPHRKMIPAGMLDGHVQTFAHNTDPRIWFAANNPAKSDTDNGGP